MNAISPAINVCALINEFPKKKIKQANSIFFIIVKLFISISAQKQNILSKKMLNTDFCSG